MERTMKRAILLGALIALATATGAAAQPAVLVKSKPIHGTAPDFKADLPARITKWEKEEIERQFENPTAMFDLELAMLMQLEEDIQRVAKRKKLSFEEVSVLVMYDVVVGAAKKMDKAVHERRAEVKKAGIPDRQDAEMRSLGRRKEALAALIAELGPRMTPNTRLLAEGTKANEMLNAGAKGK
jgi:hypothetical protein